MDVIDVEISTAGKLVRALNVALKMRVWLVAVLRLAMGS
jgi:hypothetical protein